LAAKTANQNKEIREEYRPINVEYILCFVIIFLYFVLALLAKQDDHKKHIPFSAYPPCQKDHFISTAAGKNFLTVS
jgi:hypothetical protein